MWLALWLVGMGAFFIGMPKYLDDYAFLACVRDWFVRQGIVYPEDGGNILTAGYPWREIAEAWKGQYLDNNVRMGNLLVTTFLLFPKWVGSGLMLLLWGATVMLSMKIAGVDWRKSAAVPVALVLWSFFMPWRDHFGSLDFQLNYIPGSLLGILLFYLVFQRSGGAGSRSLTGILVAGLLCGLWHEGIGVPVGVGMVVAALGSGHDGLRERLARVSAGVAGIVAGTVVILSSPGMQNRSAMQISMENIVPVLQVSLLDLVAAGLFLAVIVLKLIRGGFREVWNPLVLFCVGSGFVSLAIALVSGMNGRAMFWMDLVSILGVLALSAKTVDSLSRRFVWMSRTLNAIMLASVYVYWGFADYYSLEFRRLMKDQLERYVENPSQPFVGDVPSLGEMPLVSGYLPESGFQHCAMQYVRGFYQFGEERSAGDEWILPCSLYEAADMTGRKIDGGGGVMEKEGHYYAPYDSVYSGTVQPTDEQIDVYLDFGKGYTRAGAFGLVFASDKDGRKYVWIKPKLDWYVTHFKKLEGMRFEP